MATILKIATFYLQASGSNPTSSALLSGNRKIQKSLELLDWERVCGRWKVLEEIR
jgi:hypothetical protein